MVRHFALTRHQDEEGWHVFASFASSPSAFVPKVAILDGVAQLWEHSPQWFCLVCKHLLEIGVLSPTSVVYYVFREDNSNAIALSPFLWEV